MNINEIKAGIEAVLFSLGVSVELSKLAEIIEVDKETIKKILGQMMDSYQEEERGIQLLELDGSYQLCTKKCYYDYIQRATHKTVKFELSEVVIETLAIIAYKQPVTKLFIEKIRGVKSDHAVNKLVEFGLIEEKGRMDSPGKPILFGTTEALLRNFGLSATSDLPTIAEKQLETIKHEVEKEMQLSFDSEGEDE